MIENAFAKSSKNLCIPPRNTLSLKIERYVFCDTPISVFNFPDRTRARSGAVAFPPMASTRSEQQEEIRFRMLRLLEENPEMSTRQLASEMGISNGASYYCLNALVEKGWVKLGNFKRSEHKGRYAYVLTPTGIAERAGLTKRFLARKMTEFEALKCEIEELEAEVALGAEAKPGWRG